MAGDPRFRILDVDWQASRGACWARAEIMNALRRRGLFPAARLAPPVRARTGTSELIEQLRAHRQPQAGSHRVRHAVQSRVPRRAQRRADADELRSVHRRGDRAVSGRVDPRLADARSARAGALPLRPLPLRARTFRARGAVRPGAVFHRRRDHAGRAARSRTATTSSTPGVIVWHEYTREYREHKHWTDHNHDKGVELAWHQRDRASLEKVRSFLQSPWIGAYGSGPNAPSTSTRPTPG